MLSGLKLSAKIYLGFAVLLAIMLALGLTAIFNLNTIRVASEHLAEQEMPTVTETSTISVQTYAWMYDMRAYNYTGDEKYFNDSSKPMEALVGAMKEWQDEIKEHNNKEAQEKLNLIRANFDEYSSLRLETKKIWDDLHKDQERMNSEGPAFERELRMFLKSQNEAFQEELGNSSVSREKQLERLNKVTWINDAIDAGNAIRLGNWRSQATKDAALMERTMQRFEDIDAVWNKLRPIVRQRENIEQMAAVKKAQDNYAAALREYVSIQKRLSDVNVSRIETGTKLLALSAEVQQENMKAATHIAEEAASRSTSSSFILMIGLLVAAGFGIVVAVIVNRGISGPIIRAIDELTQGSLQITSAAQQLSSASEELSQASSEQASSIEETSASLQEMAAMVDNNTEHAERSAASADEVKRVGERGNDSMRELLTAMNEIKESNEKIQDLVKVIAEIGEQTAVIDEIVFQTKLLSFNASVEAERAGEHGRGFAVVAHEVGNLAQMSSRAATQIATIVKESIQNAEKITGENKKRVETGHGYVQDTSRLLGEIVVKAQEVADSARQIHGASKEQSVGIGQVNQAMTQLDQVTQANAAISEESASSSEELSAQAIGLSNLVSDLTRLIHGQDSAVHGGHERNAPQVTQKPHAGGMQTVAGKGNVHTLKPKQKVAHTSGPRRTSRQMGSGRGGSSPHPQQHKVAVGAEHHGPVGSKSDDDGWENL